MSDIEESQSTSEKTGVTPEAASKTRPRRTGGGIVLPMVLIFIGVILLLNTTNVVPWHTWVRLWVLWPALLILIGVDILLRHSPFILRLLLALVVLAALIVVGVFLVSTTEPLADLTTFEQNYRLAEASRGEVILRMGVGELVVEPLESSQDFAQVSLRGWRENQEPSFQHAGGVARLTVDQGQGDYFGWFSWWPNDVRWQIGLSTRVPLELDVDTGVGESRLDLRNLQVKDLRMNTGIGEVRVTLPGGVEQGTVRIHAGIGAVRVIVPEGVAAEIDANAGIGGVSVDTSRFREVGDDRYRSVDYGEARHRLRIEVNGGIGSIDIR